MIKNNLKSIVVALMIAGWPLSVPAAERPSAAALVDQADQFRQPFDGASLKVRLISYRNGQQHSQANYHVWANGNEKSLAAMLDPKVKGQKVLMLPEGMWLHMPSSRRAIRITPMQRLMGQASYGDITQLRMGGLYAAVYDAEKPEGVIEGESVWNLKLSSKHANTTYTKIDLSVAKDSGRPVTAAFFLQSGKLLKKAVFGGLEMSAGAQFITTITFHDALRANRQTTMTVSELKRMNFRQSDFSVRALARWRP